MLLKDSILIEDEALRARVPSPMNFCLHKLLIAQRRPQRVKREKDIEQAVYVLGILEPEEFKKAVADQPKRWRQWIEKSLKAGWDLLPLERPTLEKFRLTPETQ